MEIKEIDRVSKCNEIVTYYSFLTPQYMDGANMFLNPNFHCILSNIEKATNCLITTRRLLCSELPGIRNTDARNSGYWLTEIYYHQIYGRHDVALRMIDSSMKICASVKNCSLHRTSLRTKRGQFLIEDQDILRRMTSSSKSMGSKTYRESFSKIQSQDKTINVSKNMDNETLDFGTETVHEIEINAKEFNRESEIFTTHLSNIPKTNDAELNNEYILPPAELGVPVSINNVEANQENETEFKDSSSLLKRDSEDKNSLLKTNLEEINKSDNELNNIKEMYNDYLPVSLYKYDESLLSPSKLEHEDEDLMKELVMEVGKVDFPTMTQLSSEVLKPLLTVNSFGKVTIIDLDVDVLCPTVGAEPSAELNGEYLPNISTQFNDVSYSLTEQDKSIYVELIYDEMKINADETKKMVSHRINNGKDRMITFGSVRIIKSVEYSDEDMKTSSQIDDSDINNNNFFSIKEIYDESTRNLKELSFEGLNGLLDFTGEDKVQILKFDYTLLIVTGEPVDKTKQFEKLKNKTNQIIIKEKCDERKRNLIKRNIEGLEYFSKFSNEVFENLSKVEKIYKENKKINDKNEIDIEKLNKNSSGTK